MKYCFHTCHYYTCDLWFFKSAKLLGAPRTLGAPGLCPAQLIGCDATYVKTGVKLGCSLPVPVVCIHCYRIKNIKVCNLSETSILLQFKFTSNSQLDAEPEISNLHFNVQFAFVVVEASKLSIKVLYQLVNAMQQTITLVHQSAQ